MSHTELIDLLKQKDREAFRKIVTQWQDMVYNTSLGILQNEEDAEDTTQEVFIRMYESIDQFRGDSKFSTWLYRITVSQSLDHLKSKKRKKRFGWLQSLYGNGEEEQVVVPDFVHPGVKMENKEMATSLFKAIQKLPDQQKTVFVLNKIENLSYAEIAEIMENTTNAVDSLYQRAKQNLRKELSHIYREGQKL